MYLTLRRDSLESILNQKWELILPKNQDPPEYLRQLALEIINKIPAAAMQIFTDGSKDDRNSCGSGIFIKAPNCYHNIKIRNPGFCSVFRSELIAIDEALRIIKTVTSSDEIWILCDSRNAIQHLSDWQMLERKHRSQFLKILKSFPSNMRYTSNGFHPTLVSLAMTQLTF
ncbi:RNase H domain-containing protein [Trichonephila clavipes]|nr:RNase H domain-containing protein [Trichonephila clavipes]